jgi:hypothetical protein
VAIATSLPSWVKATADTFASGTFNVTGRSNVSTLHTLVVRVLESVAVF